MGTYVDKLSPESFSLGITDAAQEVSAQIGYLKEKADIFEAKLLDLLDDFGQEFADANLPTTNINYDHVTGTIEAKNLDSYIPDPPDIDDSGIKQVSKPIKGEMVDVTLPESPSIPTFNVDEPTASFDYEEDVYSSDIANSLKTSILSILSDDGEDYAKTISDAIYDRELARLDEARAFAYAEAEGFYASRGWSLVNLNENALFERVNAKYRNSLSDLQNKVAELQGQIKLELHKFAIDSGIKYETLMMGFHNSVADRTLEAAKTLVTLVYDVYGKKVEAYRVHMEGIKAEIGAKTSIVDAQLGINKGITDIYSADVSAYDSIVKALSAVIDTEAKIYAARGNVFGEVVKLESVELNARVEKLRALINQSTDLTNMKIKEAEVNMQAYISSLNLSAEVSTAIARILAQIVASALGAVNTHIGKSDDTNRSISERHSMNQQISNSLGETHTIEG